MADNSTAALLQKTIMTALSQPPAPQTLELSSPAAVNPAIARCLQVYADAREAAISAKKDEWNTNKTAKAAYRNALPPLTGAHNIRDFIACVAHALALNAIDGSDVTRLLYAAQ